MIRRPWTQTELDELADMMDTHTAQELAEYFERHIGSIYAKIREIRKEQNNEQ